MDPTLAFALALNGVPHLTEENYDVWRYTVEQVAAEHGLQPYFDEQLPQNIDTPESAIKKAQSNRLIVTTITPPLLNSFGRSFLQLTPHAMMAKVAQSFVVENVVVRRQQLNHTANNLFYKPDETIKEYVARHVNLRAEMELMDYPGIENEQTTVLFIISGLRTHPLLQAQVPTLTINPPQSIQQCRSQLEQLTSLITRQPTTTPPNTSVRTNLYCRWHDSFGTHATDDFWSMQNAQRRQFAKTEPITSQ